MQNQSRSQRKAKSGCKFEAQTRAGDLKYLKIENSVCSWLNRDYRTKQRVTITRIKYRKKCIDVLIRHELSLCLHNEPSVQKVTFINLFTCFPFFLSFSLILPDLWDLFIFLVMTHFALLSTVECFYSVILSSSVSFFCLFVNSVF